MKFIQGIKNDKGATFLVWLLVIAIVFSGIIASLMTGNTQAYRNGVDFYRRMQAMYIAEGGVAKAISDLRVDNLNESKTIFCEIGTGKAEIKFSKSGDNVIFKSSGYIKNGNAVWVETVVAQANSSNQYKINRYYWMGKNEK